MKSMKPHQILKQFFDRKKEQNSAYSLRALARDAEVSPAFVSGILSGKKKIPVGKLEKFGEVLEIDATSIRSIKKAIAFDGMDEEIFRDIVSGGVRQDTNLFKPLPRKKISLLSKWYYVAVLDLMTCHQFQSDETWISRKLGLLPSETKEALLVLKKLNLIEEEKGLLKKKIKKIRFTTTQSQVEIRQFHKQMIQKALQELEFKTSTLDFNRRLIAGITLSASKKAIKKAKHKLSDVLHEIANELMDDTCDEVYQLNLQFFPLTKSE